MLRRLRRGALAAALPLLLPAAPAQAEFGDCSTAAWLAEIRPELAARPYDCVEAFRLPIPAAGGGGWIRVVHDREAGWILDAGLLAELRRGLEGAVTAMERLGPFRMSDATFLLADDLPPGVTVDGRAPAEGEILAETDFDSDSECIVAFYLLGRGVSPAFTATRAVHELFHCVQKATLGREMVATGNGGLGGAGDWWIEGSAEWFTALALPDAGPLPDRVADFDARSPATSLQAMAYEAVPFFLWLAESAGPDQVLPFLARQARSRADGAQWTAMAASLPANGWLTFAQRYRDTEIAHPHGTSLPFAPDPGDTWIVDRTRTLTGPATPFTLLRGTAELACGRWRLSSSSPGIQVAQRPAEGGDWSPFAGEIAVPEGETLRLSLVMINTAAGRRPLSLRFERLATCLPCAGSRETDRCLVGAWSQSGGGPAEWLRATLPPEIQIPSAGLVGEALFVMLADGSYVALPKTAEATLLVTRPGGLERAEGSVLAQGAGRWSVAEGRLYLCQDSGGLHGSMTLTGSSGSSEHGLAAAGAGILAMDYACGETSLDTSLLLAPDLPPMVTTYERLGGE